MSPIFTLQFCLFAGEKEEIIFIACSSRSLLLWATYKLVCLCMYIIARISIFPPSICAVYVALSCYGDPPRPRVTSQRKLKAKMTSHSRKVGCKERLACEMRKPCLPSRARTTNGLFLMHTFLFSPYSLRFLFLYALRSYFWVSLWDIWISHTFLCYMKHDTFYFTCMCY